jgi:pilus assembly protein Flp/PilA
MHTIRNFFQTQGLAPKKGQSLAEYGLILALVAIVCITALGLLGKNISGALNNIATQLNGAFNG